MSRAAQCSSIAFTIVALAAFAACDSSSGRTSSLIPFIPGPAPTVYAGSIADSVSGTGTLRLALSTESGVTSGTWDATYNGRTEMTRVVDGAVADNVFTGTVRMASGVVTTGGCTFRMNATFSATGLSGSYSEFAITRTCPTPQSGSFTLARQ